MELINIGVVANTHGLRGTVKVKSFTDFVKERYKKGNVLYILFKKEYIPFTVDKFRTTKGLEYVDFVEITDINVAEKYKGCELFFKKTEEHVLPADEFYFRDLIGMEVHTDTYIGVVHDIREYPQGEYLIVKRDGLKNAIIPFIKEFVVKVDEEGKKIFITEMEGLL